MAKHYENPYGLKMCEVVLKDIYKATKMGNISLTY